MKSIIRSAMFLLFTLVFISPVHAQKIDSYGELFNLLPGGSKNIEANKLVVENAQKLVAERQMLRRKRTLKFVKPINYEIMNEKYVSVAFQVEILPKKEAVIAVLFETNAENPITYPNTIYVAWVGENDLKQYNNMKIEGLYESYREMGAEDCKPGFVRTGMEKALLGKADMTHTHTFSDVVSRTIPDSMIDERIARAKEVSATIAALENKIAHLEKKLEAMTELLSCVTRNGGNLVFSGVNVQIVNGKGSTGATNGKGNLIIGYNESRGGGDIRDGSHNIIVGTRNNYASTGGIVTGLNNTISGRYASVLGGVSNVASGELSTITGGEKNHAKGKGTSINGMSERTKVAEGDNPHFRNN